MDGSMDETLVATTTFSQVDGKYLFASLGMGHYGQAGASVEGVTDGIVWADSMWSSYPDQSDLRIVRTGENTAEMRGTNWVDYVPVSDEGHWVNYSVFDEYGRIGESHELPLEIQLNLTSVDSMVLSLSRSSWSCSAYPDFFGAGATYLPTITNPAKYTIQKDIVAPNAPTITGSPASVVLIGTIASVSWSPNHPDLTEQSAAQVKVDSETYNVSGTTTTFQIPSSVMDSAGTHTVSVRTQNAVDQSWGAWSSQITFQVGDMPQLSVSSPTDGYVLQDLPLTIQWYCTSENGISQQLVEIQNSIGSIVWQSTIPVGTMEAVVGREQYYLETGKTYSVRVEVTNGIGLSNSVTVPFSVLYVGPDDPIALFEQGDGCSGLVSVSVAHSPENPDADSVDVYRLLPDGSQSLVGTLSGDGGLITDFIPPLNVDFSYRVVAFSESGASTAVSIPARVDSGGMEAWNFGPSASTALLLGLNASGSRSTQFSGETFHFALGPGTPALPTFYPDGDLDATGSHSYVVHGVEDYLRVRSVVEDPNSAVCWFRDAFGGRHTVHASWQTGYDASSYDLFTVTASATEVVWEEPTI